MVVSGCLAHRGLKNTYLLKENNTNFREALVENNSLKSLDIPASSLQIFIQSGQTNFYRMNDKFLGKLFKM